MNKQFCDFCNKELSDDESSDMIASINQDGKESIDSDDSMMLFVKIERFGDVCNKCLTNLIANYFNNLSIESSYSKE